MTSSARDARYGRRGGKWDEAAGKAAELQAATAAHRRRSTCPDRHPGRCGLCYPYDPTRRDLNLDDPDVAAGLARMAHARQAAGRIVTGLDARQALAEHPDPATVAIPYWSSP